MDGINGLTTRRTEEPDPPPQEASNGLGRRVVGTMPAGKIPWWCPNCHANIYPDQDGRCLWCLAKAEKPSEQRVGWQQQAAENHTAETSSRWKCYGKKYLFGWKVY